MGEEPLRESTVNEPGLVYMRPRTPPSPSTRQQLKGRDVTSRVLNLDLAQDKVALVDEAFAALDSDGSGKLSMQELEKAAAMIGATGLTPPRLEEPMHAKLSRSSPHGTPPSEPMHAKLSRSSPVLAVRGDA